VNLVIPVVSGKTVRFQVFYVLRISRQSAHAGCKVGNHIHRPPLPPGYISGTNVS
jgi:hypothetical protein